jgi:polyisoprenoid-binding protein YceI
VTRRLLVGLVSVVVLLALAGGGAYVYFFSNLRSSPTQLVLASPTTTTTASPSTATTSSGLAGTWKVTSSSVAGYRVKELFVGETSKHEAVARTSAVSGSMSVGGDATSGYRITAITITADLTGLHSVDTVAGRDVTQRDFFVSRDLDLQSFPTATFTATSASIAGPVTTSRVASTIAGSLTIHGVTKQVTATVQAQVAGGKIEIAGSVNLVMTDYGINPPQVPFTAVDAQVVVEFDIFLTRAS